MTDDERAALNASTKRPWWRKGSSFYILKSEVEYLIRIANAAKPVEILVDKVQKERPGYFVRRWISAVAYFFIGFGSVILLALPATDSWITKISTFILAFFIANMVALYLDYRLRQVDKERITLAQLLRLVRMIGDDSTMSSKDMNALLGATAIVPSYLYYAYRPARRLNGDGNQYSYRRAIRSQARSAAGALAAYQVQYSEAEPRLQDIRADFVRAALRVSAGRWREIADLNPNRDLRELELRSASVKSLVSQENPVKLLVSGLSFLGALAVLIAALVRALSA